MIKKYHILTHIAANRLIAIIRGDSQEKTLQTAVACIEGGFRTIEIAFTSPHANTCIEQLTTRYDNNPEILIGAGTILEPVSARIAMLAGAKFIVSPSVDPETAKICNLYQIPYMAGCTTPTEAKVAMELGVDVIKLFPAKNLGKAVVQQYKGPFPQLNIMPTGGISLKNINEWLATDIFAIGVGGQLTSPAKEGNYSQVVKNADQFVKKIQIC